MSVRDTGAAGDGSADDTAALLRAIAQATQHGCAVFLPRGRYRITQPLRLSAPLCIVGSGTGSALAFDPALGGRGSTETFLVSGRPSDPDGDDDVRLADFSIDFGSEGPQGRVANDRASGLGLRYIRGSVCRLRVARSWGIGIVLHACHDLAIEGCETVDTGRDGITGFWQNRRVRIAGCTVLRPGDDGIAFNASDSVAGDRLAEDLQVVGNLVSDGRHLGRGIYLAGVSRTLVAGNTVRSVASSGIAVQPNLRTSEPSRDVSVLDNVVLQSGNAPSLGQPLVGIRLVRAVTAEVRGNRVSASGAQGIFALACTGLRVAENRVTDWARHAPAGGLDIRQSEAAHVSGNWVDGGVAPGLLLDDVAEPLVLDNVIRSPSPMVLVRGGGGGGNVSRNTMLSATGAADAVVREGRGAVPLLVALNTFGSQVRPPADSAVLRTVGNVGGPGGR